jgi:hypothetical protein
MLIVCIFLVGVRDFEEFKQMRSMKSADRIANFKNTNPLRSSSTVKGNVTVKQVKVMINL